MIHQCSNNTVVSIFYLICVSSLVIVVMLFGLGVLGMVICSIVGAYVLWY
jgi:hypothetical protein